MASWDDNVYENRPKWPYEMWTNDWETEYTLDVKNIPENDKTSKESNSHEENENRDSVEIYTYKENGTETSEMASQNKGTVETNKTDTGLQNTREDEAKSEELNEDIHEEVEDTEGEECLVPNHWTEELDTVIPNSCPINALLQAINSPDVSISDEAVTIKTMVNTMIQDTLAELTSKYKVFKDSYSLPVGSMSENTKIHNADEFDYAIILPILAEEEYINILRNNAIADANPSILYLIGDIVEGDLQKAFQHFQMILRNLWAVCMQDHIPTEWELLNPLGHTDEESVAATFHLERPSDKTTLDLDVCFWVPFGAAGLSKFPVDELPQQKYLTENCLDENGLIYAVLPQDSNISYITNSIRFAMSIKEREALNKAGPENGRLECYRLSKCIAAAFLPKVRKDMECTSCFNCLVSSFCLKNIVLYMIAHYKEDIHWTVDKLPNRVYEVFYILTFCMKVNCCAVSAFFTPYTLDIEMFNAYDPEHKCIVDTSGVTGDRDIQCVLPDFENLKQKIEDEPSLKALADYEQFLHTSEWRYPEVLCRLTELLTVLITPDIDDRVDMVQEPGWNCFGLQLPETNFCLSEETKL